MWETAVVGGMIGILFLWTYLSFNLGQTAIGEEKQHIGIRLLLILMTFLGMGVTLFIMKLIADAENAGIASILDVIYRGYMSVFVFVIFYYVVIFIIYAINLLKWRK